MDLAWETAVKYDAAANFISRVIDADKQHWTVEACDNAAATSETVEPVRQPRLQEPSEPRPNLLALNLFSQLSSSEDSGEQVRMFNLKYSVAAPAEHLGRGTFGHVVAGMKPAGIRVRGKQGEGVAIKIFDFADRADKFKFIAALKEVATFAALPPHACVLRLLDVHVASDAIWLVFPRWDTCLRTFARGREFAGRLRRTEACKAL